jgi:hypothetical protein
VACCATDVHSERACRRAPNRLTRLGQPVAVHARRNVAHVRHPSSVLRRWQPRRTRESQDGDLMKATLPGLAWGPVKALLWSASSTLRAILNVSSVDHCSGQLEPSTMPRAAGFPLTFTLSAIHSRTERRLPAISTRRRSRNRRSAPARAGLTGSRSSKPGSPFTTKRPPRPTATDHRPDHPGRSNVTRPS